MYDPKTGKFTLIDTCFTTHHLQFAFDADNTLWTSSGGPQNPVVGWLDTKKFLESGDAAASQGWTALVLDTNGNGRRDAYVEPNQPVDPGKDKRVVAGFYGISVSPADGTIWASSLGYPGYVVHLIPGAHPPETALSEIFEVPATTRRRRCTAIRRAAWMWTPTASSGCHWRAAISPASTGANAKGR